VARAHYGSCGRGHPCCISTWTHTGCSGLERLLRRDWCVLRGRVRRCWGRRGLVGLDETCKLKGQARHSNGPRNSSSLQRRSERALILGRHKSAYDHQRILEPGNRSRFDYSVGEGWNASIRVRDPRRSRARKDHIHGSWIPANEHAKWKTTLRVESHGDLESIAELQTTPFLLRARRLSRIDTGYLSREGAMDFSHRDVSTNSDCQRRLSRRARLDLGGPPAPTTNARTIGSTRTYVLSV